MKPHDRDDELLEFTQSLLPQTASEQTIFRAPWQARVFALIVSIVKNEHVTWPAFQSRLVSHRNASSRRAASDTEIETEYFQDWLEAAEDMLITGGFVSKPEIDRCVREIKAATGHARHSQAGHASQAVFRAGLVRSPSN